MNVDDLLAIARRRWPLLVIGLLLTAGLVAGVFARIAPSYQIVARVLLVPPRSSEVTNPFFALGGLQSATDVVGRAMTGEDVVERVLASGGTDEFTVERDFAVSGPILVVTAEGSTNQASQTTMQLVLDEIPRVLEDIQSAESVPRKDRISTTVLTRQSQPDVLRKPQIRAALVALVLGLSGTAAAVALFDGWSYRRRRLAVAEPSPEIDLARS